MVNGALRVAVVGCGNISGPYGETLGAYPSVQIAGATDIDPSLSAAFVGRFGGVDYSSLEELLADPAIDAVVNLTSHGVHPQVTAAALEAHKHVHSEKPLAGSYEEARSLVELADANGVRLSCSPITFMGEAQETAWRLLASGAIGTVRVAYAEVNWGRIETWHPRPEPFYGIGPLADVGVYPLTILTAIFGPARRVTAYGRILLPDRLTRGGEHFTVRRAGLRRRGDRARERPRRTAHDELLRRPAEQAARHRVPRRHRVVVPVELAGVRRGGRAGPLRRALRAGSAPLAHSAGSTGVELWPSSATLSRRGDRSARRGPTRHTSSRSSTQSRPRGSRVAPWMSPRPSSPHPLPQASTEGRPVTQ